VELGVACYSTICPDMHLVRRDRHPQYQPMQRIVRRAPVSSTAPALVNDIRRLIADARDHVASTANATLTMLYWQVGQRIRTETLRDQRAAYGERIVASVGRQLSAEYGAGFEEKNLRRMMRFSEVFPDQKIVASLMRQLSWTHFLELLPLKDPLQREFYAEMCRVQRWSVRALRSKIRGMLYERTALSRKPANLAQKELAALRDEDRFSTDLVLRDPYLLDFLGLKDAYQERDLEAAILREMERFILELGSGFAFLSRQKRFTLDGEDFHIDLLFYQRDLRRLVAVELKLDRFRPEHKGQMELYLRWLDKHERKAGEEAPIGIILCSGKDRGRIELLELDKTGIHVAEYLTVLPPKEQMQAKLQEAVALSRAKLEVQEGVGEP
jgi:predicted nuclease of restriction endonuclease-like (RecB) superfamily